MSILPALAPVPLPTPPVCRLSVFPLAKPLIVANRRKSGLIRSYIAVSYAMWATCALAAAGVLARIALAADFDWSAIVPSEQLKYHPCYDGYQCARLAVPYDPHLPTHRTACACSSFNNGRIPD